MRSHTLLASVAVAAASSLAFSFVAIGCGSGNSEGPKDAGKDGEVGDAGLDVKEGGQDVVVEARAPLSCPAAPDAGAPAGYPAAHAPFPDVIYLGAGILPQPEIVTVTFPNDALATQLQQFDDDITDTCWWDTVRQGFCTGTNGAPPCLGLGAIPPKPHVALTTAAAATYTDTQTAGNPATLQTFIQQQVATGAFPAPDANTLYVMYFPASTTITLDGSASCQAFGGYHQSVEVTPPGGSAIKVAYAVIPRCTLAEFSSPIDELTFAASHEITEAATDPFASSSATGISAGFYVNPANNDNAAWNLFGGGEVGDLCVDLIGESHNSPHDEVQAMGAHGTYAVQRMWSIAAAAAGGDPCVPVGAGDTPYFNVAIASGQGLQQLAVGASVTFEADAFSNEPLGAPGTWNLSATSLNALEGKTTTISVSVDKTTVTNGDKVMVTVKLNSAPPTLSGTTVNGEEFILVSQSGSTYRSWPGLVIQSTTGMVHPFSTRNPIHR